MCVLFMYFLQKSLTELIILLEKRFYIHNVHIILIF